jgi:hypothetical protein
MNTPFRLEIWTLPNDDAAVRVFQGANLNADHSSPSNYTEFAPTPAKRYYVAGAGRNRFVGMAAVDWTLWPSVGLHQVDPGGVRGPTVGAAFADFDFSATGWVGPRSNKDGPYWGVSE